MPKPMLAGKFDERKLTFPIFAQPKLDGIRALCTDGDPMSRSWKPLPNRHVAKALHGLTGLDGELTVGDPTAPDCFRKTTSAVMSPGGIPDFTYWVFDKWNADGSDRLPNNSHYSVRWTQAARMVEVLDEVHVTILSYAVINSLAELDQYEADLLEQGFEGVILRKDCNPYKFGRGSATKFDLIKLKRFIDFEAVVVGADEEQYNGNMPLTNALGRTERSTSKAGLIGKGTLGSLRCKRVVRWTDDIPVVGGLEFGVGTGFNADERAELWKAHLSGNLKGRIAKVKSFAVGEHERPRFPVFLGFRDRNDL